MTRRAQRTVVEIRRGYIAIAAPPQRIIVMPRNDARGWPDPAGVRALCEQAGFRMGPCSVILPRSEWLVGVGKEQKGKRSEILAAARLEAEMAASAQGVDVVSGVSMVATGPGIARSFWASLPLNRAQEVIDWATRCGWDVKDIRCAPFETARNVQGTDTNTVIAFYPGGEWELHRLHGSVLTSTYAGVHSWDEGEPQNFHAELFQTLRFMNLSDDDFHLDIHTSGPVPSGIEAVFQKLRDDLQSEGVTLTWKFDVEPPLGSEVAPWPGAAVLGVLSRNSGRNGYPVIWWAEQKRQALRDGKRTGRRNAFQLIVVSVLLASITAGLGVARHRVVDRLSVIQASTANLHAGFDRVASVRHDRDLLETKVGEVQQLIQGRHHAIEVLMALEDALLPGAHLESLVIEGDTVRLGLVASSVVAVVERMQTHPAFQDVAMETPVTADGRDSVRQERVVISARVADFNNRRDDP